MNRILEGNPSRLFFSPMLFQDKKSLEVDGVNAVPSEIKVLTHKITVCPHELMQLYSNT